MGSIEKGIDAVAPGCKRCNWVAFIASLATATWATFGVIAAFVSLPEIAMISFWLIPVMAFIAWARKRND